MRLELNLSVVWMHACVCIDRSMDGSLLLWRPQEVEEHSWLLAVILALITIAVFALSIHTLCDIIYPSSQKLLISQQGKKELITETWETRNTRCQNQVDFFRSGKKNRLIDLEEEEAMEFWKICIRWRRREAVGNGRESTANVWKLQCIFIGKSISVLLYMYEICIEAFFYFFSDHITITYECILSV